MTDIATVAPGDLIRADEWNHVVEHVQAAAPPGTVVEYAGTTTPTGWLPCDGRAIPQQDADLRAALGGAATVPDRRAPVATLLGRHAAAGPGSQSIARGSGFVTVNDGTAGLTVTKRSAASDLLVEWSISGWADQPGGRGEGGFGRTFGRVHLSGPNTVTDGRYPYYWNTSDDHRTITSAQRVPNLAAGNWAVRIQISADEMHQGCSFYFDYNDALTLVVWEVQARNFIIKC